MIVADSNLVVALVLEHPQHQQARQLLTQDPDWHLPDWWLIEVANALRNYHRIGSLSKAAAVTALQRAQTLFPQQNTHLVDAATCLRLACDLNISAYDARFIALARDFRQPLVTEDARLRHACPHDTLSLDDALRAPLP